MLVWAAKPLSQRSGGAALMRHALQAASPQSGRLLEASKRFSGFGCQQIAWQASCSPQGPPGVHMVAELVCASIRKHLGRALVGCFAQPQRLPSSTCLLGCFLQSRALHADAASVHAQLSMLSLSAALQLLFCGRQLASMFTVLGPGNAQLCSSTASLPPAFNGSLSCWLNGTCQPASLQPCKRAFKSVLLCALMVAGALLALLPRSSMRT